MSQIIFTGGLGNQMFEYALYLGMLHRGRKPKINTGIITRHKTHNGFELCDVFNIDRASLDIVNSGRVGGDLTLLAQRCLKGLCCYFEDQGVYSEEVFSTSKALISGFWQNERYFSDISDEVRKAFTFRGIDQRNQLLGDEMSGCNSVSVHIRRGDYLMYDYFQACTPEYYRRAIEFIISRVEKPLFFVFSDDLAWSGKFMEECGVEYRLVDHNRGKDSYKDMYLMSRCRHYIIANSSFSWWGAWLGEDEGKTVACPSEWFKGKTNYKCPAGWVRIKV